MLPARINTGTEEEWWGSAPNLGVIMSGTLDDRFGFSTRLSPSTTLEFVSEYELKRRRVIVTPVYDAILRQIGDASVTTPSPSMVTPTTR